MNFAIWLVPTIGFLGTIYGIGTALGEADSIGQVDGQALQGAIREVTDKLEVAFDTTMWALILSAILLLVQKAVERYQDQTAAIVAHDLSMKFVSKLTDYSPVPPDQSGK